MAAARALRLSTGVLFWLAAHAAGAQSEPVPVVAIGEGRTFAAALSSAVRMAVESGAGATVVAAASSNNGRIATDSIRAVSRGVVTRYILLDSSSVGGGARVRILAMVSRIAERSAAAAPAERLTVPGALWSATADLDVDRRRAEGDLLFGFFGAIDRQAPAYAYAVESGPPVESGAALRLRVRLIRTPSAAYGVLRDRALSMLSAVAGPAGTTVVHLPPLEREQVSVRSCVSHCGPDERRVLNTRAALEDTDSLGAFDPPVLTRTRMAPMESLFPSLTTVGGFAVEFVDSTAKRATYVHVRSTRGYLAAVDYLRSTFDDARFRLEIGDRAIDLMEIFRDAYTGQPAARLETTAPAGTLPIALVQGFHPHTRGGPGAPTMLGSPYVVISIPAAAALRADTALVDVWLTHEEVARISELGVDALATTRRLPPIPCATPPRPAGHNSCARPSGADVAWRALDETPPAAVAALAAGALPAGALGPPATPVPARAGLASAGDRRARATAPAVPLAVIDAIGRAPLSDGDGALAVPAPESIVVAVGTGVVDPSAPTEACAVARLRAQRELTRFLTGSRMESRSGLTTSESRGSPVEEHFREDINEVTAGWLSGAAIAAQWSVPAPERCRVALWIVGTPASPRDAGDPRPR